MFQMIRGAHIAEAEGLTEGYATEDEYLIASVSAEHIRGVFDRFIEEEGETYFTFWIENPVSDEQRERVLEATDGAVRIADGGHRKTWYMDTLSGGIAKSLLNSVGEVLIHDGLCRFGLSSQRGNEIGKYEYNEMRGMSQEGDLSPLIRAFEAMGIPRAPHLRTGWDFVSAKHPGECTRYTAADGRTADSIITGLQKLGLYEDGAPQK